MKMLLRIVVQRVSQGQGVVYRLIAYGGDDTYRPVEFGSIDSVRSTLCSVVPDLDLNTLSKQSAGSGVSILLAETIEIDEPQLAALGLSRKTGGSE